MRWLEPGFLLNQRSHREKRRTNGQTRPHQTTGMERKRRDSRAREEDPISLKKRFVKQGMDERRAQRKEQGCLQSLKGARKLNSLEKRKELFSRIERAG